VNLNERILPETLRRLIMSLREIPGVGEKTAMRYSLAISDWPLEKIQQFAQNLLSFAHQQRCSECFALCNFEKCDFCLEEIRLNSAELCVVSTYSDFLALAKIENFKGLFHILGGVLDPLSGIGPEELTLHKLFLRIKDLKIKNLILALNPSLEGDITSAYIREHVGPDIRIERIGFGVPVGGSLEYLDVLTLTKALENRRIF
jgi:recombination protein RecR